MAHQERRRPLKMVREEDELGAPAKRRLKKVNEAGQTEWVQPREVPVYPVYVEPPGKHSPGIPAPSLSGRVELKGNAPVGQPL